MRSPLPRGDVINDYRNSFPCSLSLSLSVYLSLFLPPFSRFLALARSLRASCASLVKGGSVYTAGGNPISRNETPSLEKDGCSRRSRDLSYLVGLFEAMFPCATVLLNVRDVDSPRLLRIQRIKRKDKRKSLTIVFLSDVKTNLVSGRCGIITVH